MDKDRSDETSSAAENTNTAPTYPNSRKLYRLPKSGKIAGVCSGLADYLDLDVTLLRIIFVVFALASSGFGIMVYIVLAIVMPVGEGSSGHEQNTDIGENVRTIATDIRGSGGVKRLRNFFGIGLVLLGFWLLLIQYYPQWASLSWGTIWPVVLLIFGLILISRGRG